MEAIRIGDSATSLSGNSKTIIYQNRFENMDGEIEVLSIKACENLIIHNELINSEGTITLRHGDRNIVRRNKCNGNKKANSGGIRVIGEDHIIEDNL